MDLNTLRSLVTVVSFAVFLGIIAWTFARANRAGFDAAAALPFEGDTPSRSTTSASGEAA